MQVGQRGVREITEVPPSLALSPEESAALAAALGDDPAACAALYDRKEQAHGGDKSRPGLLRPIARQSIAPRALALDGGEVQAMPPCIGQGHGQDDLWLRRHWRVGEATLGDADGGSMVAAADVPKPGEDAVGGARQWGGHWGTVDHCHAGVVAASASRQGETRLERRR